MEHVWTRIGSAEVATDPMGIELMRRVHHAHAPQPMDPCKDTGGIDGTNSTEHAGDARTADRHDTTD